MHRPILCVLLGLAAAACGGSAEKEAFRAYEAAVESLMAEDGRVSSDLSDLRKDLLAANAVSEEQDRYAREQGTPFYARFREAAAAVPVEDPRLAAIHGKLIEYLDQRLGYLDAVERFAAAAASEALARVPLLQAEWETAYGALLQKTGGQVSDREAVEAMGYRQFLMERILNPFQRGQTPRAEVEKAIRGELLPRLARVLEKHADPAPGSAGELLAAWARAETAFFAEIAGSLEAQETLQKAAQDWENCWNRAEELRGEYLADLRAYRESQR